MSPAAAAVWKTWWPFNEEIVIRAVYNSRIPLISAVGHETDTMLIDYVSDLRAPTPTGAAEFAVPVRTELQARILTIQSRMFSSMTHYLNERRNLVTGLGRGIPNLSQILQESRQKLDDRIERLNLSFKNLLNNKLNRIERVSLRPYYIKNIIERQSENLKSLSLRLDSVSVDSVLARGVLPGLKPAAAKPSIIWNRPARHRLWKSALLTENSKPNQ